MQVEKITITRKTRITTPVMATSLGLIIVLHVCCFFLLSELVTPISITTDVRAHSPSSISKSSTTDNLTSIVRTMRYVTVNKTSTSKEDKDINNQENPHLLSGATANLTTLYQCKGCNDQNLGFVDIAISISDNFSSRHRRHRSSSFGKNNNNKNDNNDFGFDGIKKADDNIINSGNSTSKLAHSSFRIEQDVIKSLERVAATRDMSLSSLVNKILKNYVTSEIYFEELGFLLVSKNFLRKTFEGLDQRHIEELGKEYGLTIAKEYISYFHPKVNVNTLIQFLENWFKRFQSCQHRIDQNNDSTHHYFTVNHDINMNYSSALQSILVGLIEPIIKNTVEFTNVTPSSIAFSFEVFRE